MIVIARQVKSYLCATIIPLNIYESELDDLDIHGIAEKFTACKEGRRGFFGSFE